MTEIATILALFFSTLSGEDAEFGVPLAVAANLSVESNRRLGTGRRRSAAAPSRGKKARFRCSGDPFQTLGCS